MTAIIGRVKTPFLAAAATTERFQQPSRKDLINFAAALHWHIRSELAVQCEIEVRERKIKSRITILEKEWAAEALRKFELPLLEE